MIGIVDMDVLVYRALAKHMKDGGEIIEVFDNLLENIEQNAACETYSYHLSGTGNFRKNIKQGFTKYKGKRKDKPALYNFLRNYVADKYQCISVNLYEADDTAAIEATELRKAGKLYTLITVDKDWQQVGGLWHNISYGSVKAISIDQGLRFFNRQLLIGDTVDNIPGLRAVGPVKAEKALKGMTLIQEVETIEDMYNKVYKNDSEEVLNAMGNMLWLRRSYEEGDWTSAKYKEYLNGIQNKSN